MSTGLVAQSCIVRKVRLSTGRVARTFTVRVGQSCTGRADRMYTGRVGQSCTGRVARTFTGRVGQSCTGLVGRTFTVRVGQSCTGLVGRTFTVRVGQSCTGRIDRTFIVPGVQGFTGRVGRKSTVPVVQGYTGREVRMCIARVVRGYTARMAQGFTGREVRMCIARVVRGFISREALGKSATRMAGYNSKTMRLTGYPVGRKPRQPRRFASMTRSTIAHLAKRLTRHFAGLATASMLMPAIAMADNLQTNQAWIEGMQRSSQLAIASADDAFAHVFSQLPAKVFVYPTENYYYFTFTAGGVVYAGNLRLAAQDRDKGIIHFAAFAQANAASEDGEMMYKALSAKDGVNVKKLAPLSYRVTWKGKAVEFQLNDVSSITPPADIVADGEKYLGLVADESGLRFFLFYNEVHKLFAYVLDDTSDVLEEFGTLNEGSRIWLGQRTGFAFYDHHHLDRRVLIGVHSGNTVVNNYHDGPADQLPENHIKDDNLRKSIVDSNPDMKGRLDEFGYLASGEGRYLIAPYSQYTSEEELEVYDKCANDPAVTPETYDACFTSGDS